MSQMCNKKQRYKCILTADIRRYFFLWNRTVLSTLTLEPEVKTTDNGESKHAQIQTKTGKTALTSIFGFPYQIIIMFSNRTHHARKTANTE